MCSSPTAPRPRLGRGEGTEDGTSSIWKKEEKRRLQELPVPNPVHIPGFVPGLPGPAGTTAGTVPGPVPGHPNAHSNRVGIKSGTRTAFGTGTPRKRPAKPRVGPNPCNLSFRLSSYYKYAPGRGRHYI